MKNNVKKVAGALLVAGMIIANNTIFDMSFMSEMSIKNEVAELNKLNGGGYDYVIENVEESLFECSTYYDITLNGDTYSSRSMSIYYDWAN